MSRVEQGAIVTLTVTFTADAADVSLTMLTPAGLVLADFPLVIPALSHGDTGVYYVAWTCPGATPVGDYLAVWTGTPGGVATMKTEAVEVHAAETAYLTVADLRGFVSSELSDASLQLLLDAAYDEIVDYAGPSGPCNELIDPGVGDLLMLSRPAESVGTVIEDMWYGGDETTLAADDYEVRSSGQTLRRLHTGTNPAWGWRGRVDVTYTPRGGDDNRKVVQLELVKLTIAFDPALASQTIGQWGETYRAGKSYASQHAEILATLGGGALIA